MQSSSIYGYKNHSDTFSPQFSGLAGGLSKTTPINADSGNGSSPNNSHSPKTGSGAVEEDPFDEDSDDEEIDLDALEIDTSDLTDRSVKILPGVRRMIDAIPEGRYAVATSGATTYCYGALERVGIVPPKVTITADDPRLKRGKPFPDRKYLSFKLKIHVCFAKISYCSVHSCC